MPALAPPVLNGVTLPRPNSSPRSREDVVEIVTLANGGEKRYLRGFRYVYRLEWIRVSDAGRAAIEDAAASLGTITYSDPLGVVSTVVVEPGSLEVEPLAGYDPIRYAVRLGLREPGVRSPFSGTF